MNLASNVPESGAKRPRKTLSAQLLSPQTMGITLSSSSGKLLQWLLRYPFQRVEDWALVMAVDRSTASRQIAKVEQLGLLEYMSPSSLGADKCNLYYLNAAGIATVAALEGTDPATLARTWGADDRGLLSLLPRLSVLVYLQNMINGLVARAPIALTPPGSRMEANWEWQRRYTHQFSYHKQEFRCVADALLSFHVHPMSQNWKPSEEHWHCAFLLVDAGMTGYRDEHIMEGRLAQFLRYRESEERRSVYRYFPPVLIMVQTPHQQEFWVRAARDAAKSLRVEPLIGAIVSVSRETDIISSWPLSWKSLKNGSPCRLEDLLVPMPYEALPQGALSVVEEELNAASGSLEGKSFSFKGRFAERSKAILLKPGSGTTEREILSFLGLRLERRHFDILHALYTLPLLTSEELAMLLSLRKDSVDRYLYTLRHVYCVEGRNTAFGSRLYLSNRGLRLIALVLGLSVQHVATAVSAEDFPYAGQRVRLQHDLDAFPQFFAPAGTTGVIASLEAGIVVEVDEPLSGKSGKGVQILKWEGKGGGVRCSYQTTLSGSETVWQWEKRREGKEIEKVSEAFSSHWELLEGAGSEGVVVVQRGVRVLLRRLVDYPWMVRHLAGVYGFVGRVVAQAVGCGDEVRWWEVGSRCERRYWEGEGWRNLRPDAALEYVSGERRVVAWVEWDEGTMTRGHLEPKVAAYVRYVQSGQWRREGSQVVPVLLVIAPHRKREGALGEVLGRELEGVGLVAWTTTARRIAEEGVLGAIWARVERAEASRVQPARYALREVTRVHLED